MDMEGFAFLAVTSNFQKKFKGKFHGVEYAWKPGETLNLPVDAAVHIFGFGEEDKTKALHRAGFLNTLEDMDQAMEKLGMFSFAPVEQVFQDLPARRARKRAAAVVDADPISNDRSPVNAGGSEGEGLPSPDGPGDEEEDDDEDVGTG